MKVVVTGGTGVIGRAAVGAMVAAGHTVDVVSRSVGRSPRKAALVESLGARARPGDVFDTDFLAEVCAGADAVVNLATQVPVGYAALLPHAWRRHDELLTRGVASVVAAARRAGVRRIVQESVSTVYADQGDDWVTEESPLEISSATEPVAVGESHIQEYACESRVGVILRFGGILGDDPITRFWLRSAAGGRPVGFGSPEKWIHLIHTDDLGTAVLAALQLPSGVYNVGAEPIRRADLIDGYAAAAGIETGTYLGPVMRRLAGSRNEPLTRSLRVDSGLFLSQSGWRPRRPVFEPHWFDAAAERAHLEAL